MKRKRKSVLKNWQLVSDRWQRCRENGRKKTKDKHTRLSPFVFMQNVVTRTVAPTLECSLLVARGNYFENLSTSFVWYRANTWQNLMTILTVPLLDTSKSVWGFGKLKLNEENSPASCFPVFFDRTCPSLHDPSPWKKTPSSSPAAVKPHPQKT